MTTKIKMDIPSWAEENLKTNSMTTVRDHVKALIKELPKGYEFPIIVIHRQMIKKKGYADLNSRRTREAIQILRENDFIKEVAWRNRVKYFTRC